MNFIMVRKPIVRRRRRPPQPVFVGEWLRRLGLKPADIARGSGVNEGYLSQIISGEKKNPSPAILKDIASGISALRPIEFDWQLFYQPPPDDEAIRAAAGIHPDILALLGQNIRRH